MTIKIGEIVIKFLKSESISQQNITTMKIKKIDFCGLEAVYMEAGGYEAVMIPSIGANMVKLYHKEKDIDILRYPTPEDVEIFKTRPQVFGMPLLFPPNRIEDGTYSYEGKVYKYPITIPAQNNYHHGIIKSQPFVVTHTFVGEDFVEVEASFFSNRVNDVIYKDFPHEFQCRMNYVLSANGLEQTVTFVNDSETPMPLGVGFHTPIRIPFGKDGIYKMWLTAGEQWELSADRSLPTGNLLPLEIGRAHV